MYSVSTKVNSYLAYFMVNHPFGTTPSARPFDDQLADSEGYSWSSQPDHTALTTTPIVAEYNHGVLTGSVDSWCPSPDVQNSNYHFNGVYPGISLFDDYPGPSDHLTGSFSAAGGVTNNNPSDGREMDLDYFAFVHPLSMPSRLPIAANQAQDTPPIHSNPSPSSFLPCWNESSPLDLTQNAPTSHNPPAQSYTTSVSTKPSAYKAVVATPGILAASKKRRKTVAKFTCASEGCNSNFTRRSSLDNHTKSHRCIQDHKCGFCDRGFTTQADCKRHQKKCSTKKTPAA